MRHASINATAVTLSPNDGTKTILPAGGRSYLFIQNPSASVTLWISVNGDTATAAAPCTCLPPRAAREWLPGTVPDAAIKAISSSGVGVTSDTVTVEYIP